jgi:transcriptional/translational regulatory protein YebC/TACO1
LGNDQGECDFEVAEIQLIPQNTNHVTGDDAALFETFLDMLTDLDDVQNVYHNAELD